MYNRRIILFRTYLKHWLKSPGLHKENTFFAISTTLSTFTYPFTFLFVLKSQLQRAMHQFYYSVRLIVIYLSCRLTTDLPVTVSWLSTFWYQIFSESAYIIELLIVLFHFTDNGEEKPAYIRREGCNFNFRFCSSDGPNSLHGNSISLNFALGKKKKNCCLLQRSVARKRFRETKQR